MATLATTLAVNNTTALVNENRIELNIVLSDCTNSPVTISPQLHKRDKNLIHVKSDDGYVAVAQTR
jgi:hypothetical protein